MSPERPFLVRRTFWPLTAVGVGFALLIASTAGADDDGRLSLFGHHYSIVAGATMFVPGESATRATYGDRSFSPAATLWNFRTTRGLGLSWDLGRRRMRESESRADFLYAGVGPRFLFADNRSAVAPYLTVRGDVYSLRLDQGGRHTKAGGNVELGASVMRHVVVSGRYDMVPDIGSVDLSGFSARLAVKIF